MILKKLTILKDSTIIIVISIFFLATIQLTAANKQCKSTVMKVVMKQCSNAILRSKRHALRLKPEVLWKDEYIATPEVHSWPKKHKIIFYNDIGTGKNDDYEKYGHKKSEWIEKTKEDEIKIMKRNWSTGNRTHRRKLTVSHNAKRRRRTKRITDDQPVSHDQKQEAGFRLPGQQAHELYVIFKRFVRDSNQTPEEAKSMFLEIAAKCCLNEELCLKEKIMSCV